MTVGQALKKYSELEIELLLEYLLGTTKEFLYTNTETNLSISQTKRLAALIKRRKKGEPIAYILGYKNFYGLRFKVNRNVLIPRPETEWLIDRIKNAELTAGNPDKKIRVLDVGTGSGCIIVTLAKVLNFGHPGLNPLFFASDISSKALSIARQNAQIPEAKIKFIKSNLFKKISSNFDVIVANLPYVPKKVYNKNIKNLKWEPKQALVDSIKDFDIYEKFFQQVNHHINQYSIIYLEIDPGAVPAIKIWVKKYLPGWKVKFFKDFRGLHRYVEIKT